MQRMQHYQRSILSQNTKRSLTRAAFLMWRAQLSTHLLAGESPVAGVAVFFALVRLTHS